MAVYTGDNVYSIDGVTLAKYPSQVVPSYNVVSRSWEDMWGQFHDIPINNKLKINMIWDCVSAEDIYAIYGRIILNKLLNQGSRIFEVNTFFPGMPLWDAHGQLEAANGFIMMNAYLGTPTQFTSLGSSSKDGSVKYWKMELHFIETDGTVLNNPSNNNRGLIENNSRGIRVNNNELRLFNEEDLMLALGGQR